MLAQKFGVALPEPADGEQRRRPARLGASGRRCSRRTRSRRLYFAEQLASPAGARARQQLAGARRHAADDRAARPRFRPAVRATALKAAPADSRVPAGRAAAERADRAARERRSRGSVPQPADGADLPRHRLGHRVRRAPDGSRSGRPEISELAGNADLLEEPHALRPESDQRRRFGKSGFAVLVEGYFDFAQVFQSQAAPAVASCGTALTHAAGAAAPPVHVEDRARASTRTPPAQGAAVAIVRAAGRRGLRRQRRRAGQRRRSRYVHQAQGRRISIGAG